ncbi:MAG TPA: SDR family NAD(P)-dependent oxidoreductase, partial [Thermodesulfobacteriota bacterium]|nr:SDR family NAD(P)-dependent oxidoreductase [Thermodesulfobacteriota bacterium]
MMGLLEGKIAIITGAGRGIGRAEALAMVKEGAKVVINDLGGGLDGTGKQAMIADEVVNEVTAMGGQAVVDYSDVGTLEGVENMIWKALNRFGRLDIMVNNA